MSPTLRALTNFWGWMHNETHCNKTDTTYSFLLLPCYHLPHWLWIFARGSEQRRLLSISEWILLWTWYRYQYRMVAFWQPEDMWTWPNIIIMNLNKSWTAFACLNFICKSMFVCVIVLVNKQFSHTALCALTVGVKGFLLLHIGETTLI